MAIRSDFRDWRRLVLVLLVLGVVSAFFWLDIPDQLSLASLQRNRELLLRWRDQAPWLCAGIYVLSYGVVTGLSLPGAALLTLAGGAMFGLVKGTILVSMASTAGASLAFLLARSLFRDEVVKRFGPGLEVVQEGIRKNGTLYLLSLRLAPVFPFFMVNLLMGLTAMPLLRYALVSQIGMLPGTIVYVNAGTQLASLTSLGGILSPTLIGSFLALALLPWLARGLNARWQIWRLYQPWQRPTGFDRNLIVIGAGAAGLVTSYIAATIKARVTLIEAATMGGDCLNTGCVPSKALIASARLAARMRRANRYGLSTLEPPVSLPQVMERVFSKVAAVAPHDSRERYEGLGVEVLLGHARLIDPWTVAIRPLEGPERQLTARAIVLATGARPVVPELPGIDSVPMFTSETVWAYLRSCSSPSPRLVVMGGGPIGCELSQALAQLGARVTLLQRSDRILRREDADVAEVVRQAIEADGVRLITDCTILAFAPWSGEPICPRSDPQQPDSLPLLDPAASVEIEVDGVREKLHFDAVICAVGREARLSGYGLEELGIPTAATITTNAYLQTLYPNIFAAGDVAGPYQFTHTAAHQAWYAAVNALFGDLYRFRVDHRVIPRTTFTDPEVASVGLNEQAADCQGVEVEVTRFPLADLDRAIVDNAETGFVKVLTPPGNDRILGVTIVGEHAGELLAEFVLAMKWGLGLGKILGTIHAYPTLAEANKYVAGEWKRNHAPSLALRWLERFHRWRRRA